MSEIQTNRDLYLAIEDLTERHRFATRDLEEYLRALWDGTRRLRERPSLSADEFFGLLSAAFILPAPAFSQLSRGEGGTDATGFHSWESVVLRQIVDLREMAEQGILEDEQRYFGINSPRGQWWCNFDPCPFLERATAGAYGGWLSGDDPLREYVPVPPTVDLPCPDCRRMTLHEFANGPYCTACAKYVDEGRLQVIAEARLNEMKATPRPDPDPVVSIHEVTWDDYRSFLDSGQQYE